MALANEICKKLIKQGNLQSVEENKFKDWFVRNNINNSLQNKWRSISSELKKTWKNSSFDFKVWYCKKHYEQNGLCLYCKIPQEYLLKIYDKRNGFREGDNKKGRRGKRLEIDRPDNENYDDKCVLACYPCNNAKSDVFDATVFQEIADAIKKEWLKMAKEENLLDKIIEKYPLLNNDTAIKEFLKSK